MGRVPARPAWRRTPRQRSDTLSSCCPGWLSFF
ncbi:MAG: hypothetical protein DMG89_00565 [Acidobacteria bacterium]|nr:MAG: hypothetical protein DMG89_00565 [Acidobacteriota bacterium]